MTATIQRWGNSQGIRLPKVLLEDLGMREGEEVNISAQDGMIIIRSTAGKRQTIQELFAGYEGDYKPDEIYWGKPKGREIW
ncbi:MAG: AbrB/MazE/SpoVT family DNA-binding domain-containing protein [Clostridiales bacterium]|nr:AbrB/MazE/SpoVT family DNA-binding domain-containing protein [Clostridiales bacterium]